MLINQISVFVENRPGRLTKITELLANAAIDIRAFSMADTTDFGITRMIVNDPDKAVDILRENGFTVSKTQVLAVRLPDVPGAFNSVLKVLAEDAINVEYGYAFLTKSKDDAFVILRVDKNERAAEILKNAGIRLLEAKEVYTL